MPVHLAGFLLVDGGEVKVVCQAVQGCIALESRDNRNSGLEGSNWLAVGDCRFAVGKSIELLL